ncbi:PerC family transcriptional regulator [Salmonella enterica subsp. enterica serovar Poona]|nr:PerC family transcriptional regulator [Salmonella enterica]EHJ8935285.1 PerC family transcriptional regulator [Salmonella enterica]EIF7446491.1 PerC family transcriptional regulator [Salmonella enterica]EIG0452732.1 PerC family transcriptional regulator [Salmonella enterica]EIG1895393.1 PerC family transcriptional regulator [Salmonella enterica]
MVSDQKAEALEARGLYRRAAARWADVMVMVKDDRERDQAAARRSACIRRSTRSPVRAENMGEIREAIRRIHRKMGMDRPEGSNFRYYPEKKI